MQFHGNRSERRAWPLGAVLIGPTAPFRSKVQDVYRQVMFVKHPDRTLLLVSHGSWIRAMSAYFTGLDETGSVGFARADNCEILKFEL